MLQSPFANLLQELIDRLTEKVPSLRFVGQDIGQLENYELRPAVSFPCYLIDIDSFNFTDAQNEFTQLGQGTITGRLGLVKYTDISNLTPAQFMENAMKYLEIEQEIFVALHGWSPTGFSRCMRTVTVTERRDDDIRVRVNKFGTSFTDTSANKKKTTVQRPGLSVGVD